MNENVLIRLLWWSVQCLTCLRDCVNSGGKNVERSTEGQNHWQI